MLKPNEQFERVTMYEVRTRESGRFTLTPEGIYSTSYSEDFYLEPFSDQNDSVTEEELLKIIQDNMQDDTVGIFYTTKERIIC